MIPGFRRRVRSAFFWDFAQRRFVVRRRRFGTDDQSHIQGSSSPIVCVETSGTNYQSTLRKIQEERRPHSLFFSLQDQSIDCPI